MSTSKKLLTVAIAAVALAAGTFATTGEASARGFRGFHGKFHFGHKWHGHRWHFSKFYYGHHGYGCYFVYKPWGKVKICPWY